MSVTLREQIQVLHVDDEPSFTEMTATFLEREDNRLTVETATSADEGLEIVTECPPDCIVSDYNMPGMDGLEFLEAVRETNPELPFILHTGKGSEAVASDAISAGVTDYLQKGSGTSHYTVLANRISNVVEATRSAVRAEQRRHRLEQILKTVPGCVVQLDADGQFVFANERAEEVLGLDTDEVTGRAYNDPEWELQKLNGEPIPDEELPFRQVRDAGEPIYGAEHTITWPDGSRKILSINAAPLFDETGAVKSVVGSLNDITEQRDRQQDLRTERRFVQQALDALEDLFYVVDADGTLRRWNETGLEVTGYSESELDEMPAVELFPEDEREKIAGGIETTLIDGEETVKADLLTAEGRRVPYQFKGVRLTDAAGTPTGLVGIGWDLTERRQRGQRFQPLVEDSDDTTDEPRRRARLGETAARLEALFDRSPDMIDIHDTDGNILDANQQLTERTGYDRSELTEMKVWELDTGLSPEAAQTLWRDMDIDDRRRVEGVYQCRNGSTFPVEVNIRRLDIEGEDLFVAISRDITERTERERELYTQNERLREFASVVSHDLRSPLTVAEGNLELAQEACESERLRTAVDAITRSQTLIDDLLTLAREGEGVAEVEPVVLADVAERSWQAVETNAETLETDATRPLRADSSRLRELFENLYRNIVEHTGDSTTVSVGATEDGFYVADTGPGIPESDREEVFERGYSTNENGTGFGLRIVEQIVDAHGWEIAVTESEQGGARFELTGVEFAGR